MSACRHCGSTRAALARPELMRVSDIVAGRDYPECADQRDCERRRLRPVLAEVREKWRGILADREHTAAVVCAGRCSRALKADHAAGCDEARRVVEVLDELSRRMGARRRGRP